MAIIDENGKYKKWATAIAVICVMFAFGFVVWVVWMFKFAELFATCDGSYTVWRRNPGAWSSYRYEIRDGVKQTETNLTYKELKDFLDECNCKIVLQEGG